MNDVIEVSERAVSFSGEMVAAILDGRKIQTRRVVSGDLAAEIEDVHESGERAWVMSGVGVDVASLGGPYVVGMGLWVRETYRVYSIETRDGAEGVWLTYKAAPEGGGRQVRWVERDHALLTDAQRGQRWIGGRFMPRWAARLRLEIVEVRLERVQAIGEGDALAEGVADVAAFEALWDRLNKRRGYEWAGNPWVWVVSFVLVKHSTVR